MGHKHKKEAKKKKKRSESPECVDVERERRHHRKHHKERHKEKHLKRKKEEEIIISDDDDLVEVPPPPKISRHSPGPPPPKISRRSPGTPSPPPIGRTLSPPPPPTIKSSSDSSLSIEETNRIRAKLGLAPLEVPSNDAKKDEDRKPKIVMGGTDMGDFVHKPAENIFEKAQTEKIKAKIAERKAKREMDAKLSKVKGLADSDSEDDVSSWVERSRKLAIEKEKAERKAKELDDMDAAFGIGDLVNDDLRITRKEAYTAKNLQGLRVEHDVNTFAEGKNVILTLKDKAVLDEDDDALVNVNLVDEERYQKNIFNKKQKPHQFGYNAYDDGEEDVEMSENQVLSKYDEEIGGEKKKSFVIGDETKLERKKMQVKEKLMAGKRLESLGTLSLNLASDYYTEQEMKVKFKKPKKKIKKSMRKMLKADDLLPLESSSQSEAQDNWLQDSGSRRRPHVDLKPDPEAGSYSGSRNIRIKDEPMDMELDTDDLPPVPDDLSGVVLDEPDDFELELALKKARKLKQMENTEVKPEEKVIKIAERLDHKMAYEESGPGGSIVLNATAEFCRTLGDIPTYGQAGNREEDEQQILELEQELKEEKLRMQEERNMRGGWNEVDMNNESTTVTAPIEAPILDAEPDLGTGIAGALKLALSKGYLEKEVSKRPSASRFSHLQAQNYSIEDKAHVEDDKFSRRERFNGPTTDFREKDGYKPNIKLDYIDDDGHKLSQKEAFRYLSHKFHGKGPSKNKVEKRMKKVEQDSLMKQMSSTDTPLGTLNMLQAKQKETQSPFVVLSGNKQIQSISKAKF
ncbi:unnamed protein product [Bemisia tabaci]|uniref:U4/U6.U5 tri-snRNP-associated protein 1 n=1 Tax=Bemisia tabaci TaxID=7038 RepID=A0A9P0F072_BEMTA|nr:unnamed protein product [Bemisia tabaci]